MSCNSVHLHGGEDISIVAKRVLSARTGMGRAPRPCNRDVQILKVEYTYKIQRLAHNSLGGGALNATHQEQVTAVIIEPRRALNFAIADERVPR